MDFTDEDLILINAAKAKGGNVWEDPTLEDIKQRIKTHYRNGNAGHCCYCHRSFRGEFKFDIDIEHVLPKSKFLQFIFELFNLNISCKRCNMLIKKERTDFLIDADSIAQNPQQSDRYHLIHPNFDYYFDYMDYEVNIKNEIEMVKFTPNRPKGEYTYDFFRLNEIEIDMFNQAQGIRSVKSDETLLSLPRDIKDDVKDLIDKL